MLELKLPTKATDQSLTRMFFVAPRSTTCLSGGSPLTATWCPCTKRWNWTSCKQRETGGGGTLNGGWGGVGGNIEQPVIVSGRTLIKNSLAPQMMLTCFFMDSCELADRCSKGTEGGADCEKTDRACSWLLFNVLVPSTPYSLAANLAIA